MLLINISNFIKDMLRHCGLSIRKLTKPHLIEGFLKRCYPVSTEYSLRRIGANTDGGYLVPDDLLDIEACFSPGVADSASFEKDMTDRGIKCYLADFSVEAPPITDKLISFEKKFLGVENSHQYMTLEDWVRRNGMSSGKDLILQMDIEGAEYDVILSTSDTVLRKFRILVIEFHDLIALSEPFGFKLLDAVFRKILNDFEIVHIHPNNIFKPVKLGGYEIPPVMEFTFLRKDRIKSCLRTTSFPHKLDHSCIPGKPDYTLPDCWFEHSKKPIG